MEDSNMDKVYGIIYKAMNIVNGKIYIGQTIQFLDKRTRDHIKNALNNKDNSHFHNAIRKYGKENFVWETIVECNSLEELNKVEIEMIKKYDALENGYNLTEGGEGTIGFRHTEETKKKMSKSHMGEKNPMYGKHRHFSKKTREMMSKTRMGSVNAHAKKYVVITLEGKKIFGRGLAEFCRNYKKEKLNYDCMAKVAQGKRKHHKRYKCKYMGT